MDMVTVSSKYQIVIPKGLREFLHIKPGDQLAFMHYAGAVELVPVRPISELRGIAKGIDTSVERDEDREF
jgi:AbrB family looped-hinge helix DNA binding protein